MRMCWRRYVSRPLRGRDIGKCVDLGGPACCLAVGSNYYVERRSYIMSDRFSYALVISAIVLSCIKPEYSE